MAFIDPVENQEQQSEWCEYNAHSFKSLKPVDVLLEDGSLIKNVILLDGCIYDPDYGHSLVSGRSTIELSCIYSGTCSVTHYRHKPQRADHD